MADVDNITDQDLLALVRRDYGERGGGLRLALALGIAPSNACMAINGRVMSLVRIAALYNFIAGDQSGTWKRAKKPVQVACVGRRVWNDGMIGKARRAMEGRPPKQAAAHLGVSYKALSQAFRRRGISLRGHA